MMKTVKGIQCSGYVTKTVMSSVQWLCDEDSDEFSAVAM